MYLQGPLEKGRWGLGTDLTASKGYLGQPDLFGLEIMPSVYLADGWQAVFRYTYVNSDGNNGIRFGRYENRLQSGRGDEYIVGQDAHTYRYEQGGAAVLGSIQPQPLENDAHGGIALEHIAAAIKPDDMHFARTRLLALGITPQKSVVKQRRGEIDPFTFKRLSRTL